MRVLIVHGWLHSTKLYESLKSDLESHGHLVTLWEMPGFGGNKPICKRNILQHYTEMLREELLTGEYSCAIGHSMGANLLLRAVCSSGARVKLILLSPLYNGIPLLKPIGCALPLFWMPFYLAQHIDNKVTSTTIKLMSLLTVNKWSCIHDDLVTAVRDADTATALYSLSEIIYSSWRVPTRIRDITIICGAKDRVIQPRRIVQLCTDAHVRTLHTMSSAGHTAVLESYSNLLMVLLDVLSEYEQEEYRQCCMS